MWCHSQASDGSATTPPTQRLGNLATKAQFSLFSSPTPVKLSGKLNARAALSGWPSRSQLRSLHRCVCEPEGPLALNTWKPSNILHCCHAGARPSPGSSSDSESPGMLLPPPPPRRLIPQPSAKAPGDASPDGAATGQESGASPAARPSPMGVSPKHTDAAAARTSGGGGGGADGFHARFDMVSCSSRKGLVGRKSVLAFS